MAGLTEIVGRGPRLSYDEYLAAEVARTGMTAAEVVARDKADTADAVKRSKAAAEALDAKRAEAAS